MSTTKLEELLHELGKPFHPGEVYWKPGSLNSDKSKALALPYATLRAYQQRLDEVCGLAWAVTYTPWGERVICHLTIGGVTRSSTGEPDSQAEKSEIAGTAAEAQAFKRACSMFSLGRYLYHLPTMWVDYDAGGRQFTAQAKAKLEGIVALHYQRTLHPETAEEAANQSADEETLQAAPAAAPAKRRRADEPLTLREQFEQLGSELYGDQWPHIRRHNVERISQGATGDADDLPAEQLRRLINGLKQLKRKRRPKRAAPNATPAAG